MRERVRVGEVLVLQRREVAIEADEHYSRIGIYSFGRGIFHRDPVPGAELGNYRFFAIEPGDLVLSNIQAWEGAIGLAKEVDAGTIGTHRFLSYAPTSDRVDANWARWFFLSEPGMELIRHAAPGTTMRNRTLAIDRFEALEIPLPPIDEQRRVADRLDRLQAASAELARRSEHASQLMGALAISASSRPDIDEEHKARAGWRRVPLGSVMTQANEQILVEPSGSYANAGIYSFGRGLFKKPNIEGATTSASRLNKIHARQFIYSRLFAFEGAYSYVPPEFEGFLVSSEFPTFDTDPEQLDARWLANYLRSPERWAELGGSSKGLGVRRQRVPVDAVLAYQVWLPSIEEQHAIVTTIDRVDRIRGSRARSEQLLVSLTPALVNQAFASVS